MPDGDLSVPEKIVPKPAANSPLEALWQTPAVVSVLLAGEGLALILALAPGAVGDRWVYFGLASLIVQWITLLALGALFVLRRKLARLQVQQLVWVVIGILLASTWMVGGLSWFALGDVLAAAQGAWLGFFLRLTAIATIVGLLALAAFQNYWRARHLAVRAKQSELEALQARIRPHFLFNTLNTGVALVHQQPDKAERLLLDLADIFRAALSSPREIDLQEELALARRYLEIETMRFGERLQVDWRQPENLPKAKVPSLSIQPLIENAVRHGIERLPDGGDIRVEVSAEPGKVVVIVSNPLPSAASANNGYKIGLKASQARIEAMTDGRGTLRVDSKDGRYLATMVLPWTPEESRAQ